MERKLAEEQEEDADVIIDTSLTPGDGENSITLVEEGSRLLVSKQLLEDYPPDATLKDFSKETFFVLRDSVQKEITEMACKKYMVMKCNSSTNQNIQAFKNFCIDFFKKLDDDDCLNYFESDILKGSKINE